MLAPDFPVFKDLHRSYPVYKIWYDRQITIQAIKSLFSVGLSQTLWLTIS